MGYIIVYDVTAASSFDDLGVHFAQVQAHRLQDEEASFEPYPPTHPPT